MQFQRVPRETMMANHAAKRLTRPVVARSTIVANVPVLLELGATVYVQFQGKPFGVPPVAWRVGQRLLALRMEAMAAAGDGILTAESSPKYYAAMATLSRVLWRHTRPVGKSVPGSFVLRVLKRLGCLQNPYRRATESELTALTDFFLQRRMASSVGAGMDPLQPSTTS
jgi:hypothetical protein